MSLHTLAVFDDSTRVGTLEYESLEERFSFVYDPGWKAAETSFSISPHILMFGQPAARGTVAACVVVNRSFSGHALIVIGGCHELG